MKGGYERRNATDTAGIDRAAATSCVRDFVQPSGRSPW
jgi:hypothetical protein